MRSTAAKSDVEAVGNEAKPLADTNSKSVQTAPADIGPNRSSVNAFNDVPPPDESWELDQLGRYAREQDQQIMLGERTLAIRVYRLGQALICAKKKGTHGKWGKFLKEYGISHTRWIRAKQLVERGTEAELLKLGLTEAYLHYGILKQPETPEDNDEGATDNGNAVEEAPKAKPAAKRTKKTPSTVTDDDAAPEVDEQDTAAEDDGEQVEEDEEFDAYAVLDEFAKRNRWDHQRQVQAMVDYWGSDVLSSLLDIGDEAEFRAFLAEQEKLPPSKDSNGSPLAVLAMLRNRLNLLAKAAIDWKQEPASDCLALLNQIAETAQQIGKGVPQ